MCKNSAPTAQRTHCIPITKLNRLILLREKVAVYCEKHMKHFVGKTHRQC
jgi:hypothetical protein